MDMYTLHKEFIDKSLYQRINLVLDHEVEIKSIEELYLEQKPFDYNISLPESISEYDLKNFQMTILEASIKDFPYHKRKCKNCDNIFFLTYNQIQQGSNSVRIYCEDCRGIKH